MDKFCPIFPFHQNEEDHLDFQNSISTFESHQQQYLIQENHHMTNDHALLPASLDVDSFLNYNLVGHGGEFHHTPFDDNNFGIKKQHRPTSGNVVDFDSNGNNKQKKAIHKEIERQRRSQMANLYASLKSLLPIESTKGRQATSELIHEAENYIRLKQKNIEELTVQRDNLVKKWSKTEISSSSSSPLPCNKFPVDISVRSYLGGMEIFISIEMRRMDGFRLSRVLELLLAEGLSVVCCICTRINGKILHTIQTEVCHLEVTDACDLKQKLFDIVNDIPNHEQLQD